MVEEKHKVEVHTPTRPREPEHMDQDFHPRRPTTDHPLNAAPRRNRAPALAVLGLIAAIALLFFFITWVRYST
ncbi:hypothetical protein [Nocardioides sp.]|uniref:hypothetical protein n=1 Tax=Nocardioides sp. TaxID=35761 RepID=UPI00261F73BD|nr:hypothetical protein [Nocardioides sp.]